MKQTRMVAYRDIDMAAAKKKAVSSAGFYSLRKYPREPFLDGGLRFGLDNLSLREYMKGSN
jgi:hypothetical protein